MTIIYRSELSSPMTWDQLDENFRTVEAIADETTRQATIASEFAIESKQASDAAQQSAQDSERWSESAQAKAGAFSTVEKGLLATSDGQLFGVLSTDDESVLSIYENVSGSAVDTGKKTPSDKIIDSLGFFDLDVAVNDVALAITDKYRRSSWFQVGPDGQPTAYTLACLGRGLTGENSPSLVSSAASAALTMGGFSEFDGELNELWFAITDSNKRRSDIEIGLDGHFTDRVIDLLSARIGSAAVVPEYPIDAVYCGGDSLTAGGWPATLATLTGWPVRNDGWGGQSPSQIAARQGGVPARLTLPGNSIPASGSVTVTSLINNPLSDGGSRFGLLCGVLGNLVMSGGSFTFTRITSGDIVPCPPNSYFTTSFGIEGASCHQTIWTGRNGFKTIPPADIVAYIRASIDYLTPRVKRVVVMSIPPWVGEEYGTGNRAKLDACNAAIAAAFPSYWLDIAAWLRTAEAATAAGITFTADDLTDISNGLTPRSLRSDEGHLNAPGNLAVGTRVYQQFQTRGWI